MALTKQKKKEVLSEVNKILDEAESVVFVKAHGLTVSEVSDLRSSLRENESGYKVVKKTLLKRALGERSYEGEIPELDGELAIAFGKDAVLPAKGIADFSKGREEQVAILGGIFEGRFMDMENMNELARIPEMETLRGMFVNVINSPIQGLVIALDAVAQKREA